MKFAHSFMMASAMSLGGARAIDERMFEGGILEARQYNWKAGDCYSSAGDLTKNGTYTWQTSGACRDVAQAQNAKVIALTGGDTCYYGNDLPPSGDKIDSSSCNINCQGFPDEKCGGQGAYLVWADGDVGASGGAANSDDSGSSAKSPSTPSPSTTPPPATTTLPPAVVATTVGGTTIIVTNSPIAAEVQATVSVTPSNSGEPSNNGTNKAAIAAGVVVGVVGLAAIIGGAFMFLRSKKQRQEAAELHRQNSSSGFASRGEKPPSMYSMTDSRLEPAFMRRMSDGSIADNQDYSRRILKVTNPDDR